MLQVADMLRHLVQQFLQILTNFITQIGHYAILNTNHKHRDMFMYWTLIQRCQPGVFYRI